MKLYVIENDYIIAKICDFGATLTSLYIKKYDTDVVLGFNDLNKYENEGKYFGQTIGRMSNRIKDGAFKLDNKEYKLEINDNGINNLHSGSNGLHTRYFKVIQEESKVSCYYTLEDQEDGFPGKLDVIVIYELIDNSLKISMSAKAHANTICSLTNHSYFNLKGKGTIEDHYLWIDANTIGELNDNGVTTTNRLDVVNTPFNFKEPKLIKDALNIDHPQILSAKGIDHNYCFNKDGYKCKAILSYEDRIMKMYTNMNNMHCYTGNYFEGQIGKNDIVYNPRSGIAFENQEYPNSINYNEYKQPILLKDETFENITTFEFN